METAIGQFARLSPLQIWRCAPIATGVGVGMLVLCSIIAIYYNVIMAYCIIYLGASFRGIAEDVPWSYCGEWWGADENCVTRDNLTESQADQLQLKRWENIKIFHERFLHDTCMYLVFTLFSIRLYHRGFTSGLHRKSNLIAIY